MKFAIVVFVIFFMALNSLGIEEGLTSQKRHFISGGVSPEEREMLQEALFDHNLWILTAKKRTGEYLAGAQVRIWTKGGTAVLETYADGPWLFVDLRPGQYTVEVFVDSQIQTQTVNIRPNPKDRVRNHQLIFYFN